MFKVLVNANSYKRVGGRGCTWSKVTNLQDSENGESD